MGREWPPYASARSSRVHDSASSRRRRSPPTRAELPSALCPLPSALVPQRPGVCLPKVATWLAAVTLQELQEPVPEESALDMLRVVKQVVRDQQRCPNCDGRADDKVRGRRRPTHPRSVARPICAPAHSACASGRAQAMGALHPLSPTELASRCACCWHVDFVGGARRRGKAGHDADLLVWHKQKAASWGSGRSHCALGLQPHVFEAATPCVQRLQPHVFRGCGP